MLKGITSTSFFLSALLVGCLLAAGCGGSDDEVAEELFPELAPVEEAVADVEIGSVDLRRVEEDDLARVRDHHSGLIASMPTATPLPPRVGPEEVSRYLLDAESVLLTEKESLVTDPTMGIWWYRSSGGDWTTKRYRNENPYGRLFYSNEYEPVHSSFGNGGIQEQIGQRLAEGAELLLPEIRGRGASLVSPLVRNLGWELASLETPVVRVWSSFTYLGPTDNVAREYRVGGVLAFGVKDYVDSVSGDVIYQYLMVDNFLGNGVIIEDAGELSDR